MNVRNGLRQEAHIALLIDADNAPAAKIDAILTELSTFGVTNVRRAYGNWKENELKSWEEKLHEHAIRPMHQFDYSRGNKASFDSRNYGYATLSKLLGATGAFELREEGTPKVSVRDKRHFLVLSTH
nr:NYN domain-containing protein [uncultured Albidiferax sp.]